MKKITVFTLILITAAVQVSAQNKQTVKATPYKQAPLTQKGAPFFHNPNYDFGVIYEEKGKAYASFFVKNIGKGDLTIRNIDVSCGCTATEWNTNPIKSGEEAEIKVSYDAKNRVGEFNKSVTVHFTNSDPEKVFLTIKGKVIKQNDAMSKVYPFEQGNLRLSTIAPVIHSVQETAQDSTYFSIYNTSDKRMDINGFKTPAL